MNRRTFLISTISAVGCSRQKDTSPLARAAEWLWTQQAEDGGFHSATYEMLKSGRSLTPLALGALLDVSENILVVPKDRVERGLAFLKKKTTPESLEDINSATARAVSVIVKAKRAGWQDETDPLLGFLRSTQFSEDNASHGGWGPDAAHVDLSITRIVLEGLRDGGVPPSDALMKNALVYLKRTQNDDGGFYASPVNLAANKAGAKTSYGTATADGVLALLAAGVSPADPRVTSAREWLQKYHHPERAPGFDAGPYTAWGLALRYYYGDVISRAMPGLPVLLPPQRKDGSFWNSNNLAKENDPILATAFAVRVLVNQLG